MTARRDELAAFLRAARERVRPQDVGLPALGRRRTPGLRRQEVAELAAVSIDWYVRLEQGRVGTPGSAVLDGIAAALLLSPAERVHLHLIARGEAPPRPHVPAPLGGGLLAVLNGMPLLPAYVVDFRFDILACNAAASALFGPGFGHGRQGNTARMLFLDPETRETNLDWAAFSREMVGNLRVNHARHPDDPHLAELIAELRTASAEFAAWWDDQHVHERSRGTKRFRHATAGTLTVAYDMLAALDGSDQRLFVLTPADEPSERLLRTLVTAHATTLASAV
ncbi:helix-turn-helix transcriptional regulator [Actinomadura violacea]|uniref:Helix-turn-helix domain-containing protein n=1 Tax=Actinomadura violacea TaxID=2819934 RepID=A0ABS3RHY4_9ACTN|nr:helix-turn-helix transcriptional regulator [Actinomadura violacea]MBO2456201.1 helix-turn-helix domain-containing protein [Actinomadura violacea]